MVNLVELYNEARPLIELQASFTTFRVTSGLWKTRFLIIISMIIICMGISFSSWHLVVTFVGQINMNITMSSFVCIAHSQYPLKSLCGLFKRKTFYKFVEEIKESYHTKEYDKELNDISENYLENCLKIWKGVYLWTIRLFILCTIVISLQFRFSTIGRIMDLPFLPSNTMFWNEIPYFFQFLSILSTALSSVTADMTAIFTGLEIMATLDILKNFIKLINEKIKTDPKFLKSILKRHCKVIEKINLLNEAVYEISFIQIVISILTFLLLFVFILKETKQLSGYTTILCMMLQILPLCVFGELIKIKTENLPNAIYAINWYELKLRDQKTFLIILGMAQRQYGLKAAGMYEVDIYVFIQIVKIAFSYCAILYTLSN